MVILENLKVLMFTDTHNLNNGKSTDKNILQRRNRKRNSKNNKKKQNFQM